MTQIRAAVERFASSLAEGSSVLDVGCGLRPYEPLFAGCTYTGVDVEDSGRHADEKAADVLYDGRALPFPDGSYDAVLFTQVLEHVTDPDAVLGEIHRVLAPGGRLFLTVPFMWGEHEVPFDFRRFSSFGIARTLTDVGFDIDRQEKLSRGVDAIQMLVASEIVNDLTRADAPPRGFWCRVGDHVAGVLWAIQLRLWRRLYRFDRLHVDNAVLAVRR